MAVLLPTDVSPIAKTIVNSDGTNKVDLLDNSAGSKTRRVEALSIVSDDTANMVVDLWLYSGSVSYRLGAIAVPTLSGSNGSAARVKVLDTLGTVESDNIPALHVPAGCKLQASVQVAVTSAKTLTVVGRARKYE